MPAPTVLLVALAALQAAGTQPPVGVQARNAGYAVVDGRQVYEPVYFANITPRTASDMLFEVPGFSVTSTGGGRGLGQGGTNVLINGARITGKGTGPVDILGRTPASAVLRIEIVDAASLGIPGLTGQVADVYLAPQGLTGNWAYAATARRNLEPNLGDASVSVSGQRGPVTYTLGVGNNGGRFGNRGPEVVIAPDGTVIEERFEDAKFYRDRPEITGALIWNRQNGDLANLSASYEWGFFSDQERRNADVPDGAFSVTESSRKEDERNGELSGDYAMDILGGRLKLIGLASFEHSPVDRRVFVRRSDGTADGGFFDQVIDEAERIGRAEMVWAALGGTLEVAAEGAFNRLEATDEGGDILADGARVTAGTRTAEVRELRGQASLALSRPLGPLAMQASVGAEASEISQPGGSTPPRTLLRPRGFVSAAYDWGEDADLLLRLERRVGQLDFFDFVTSVDLVDGTEQCANPDIVPQQSWFLEGQAVRRFGAQTQVTLSAFAERVTDRVDTIALPCGTAGPGNIDAAEVYGGSAQGTVSLASLVPGLEFDFEVAGQESRLDDPFDGRPRAFGGDEEWFWSIDLRRDVPGTPWSYGAGANQSRFARRPGLQDASRDTQDPRAYVFVEHRDVFGAELNVRLGNVTGQVERTRREAFADADTFGVRGPLAFIEERERTFGPILRISLSDTF